MDSDPPGAERPEERGTFTQRCDRAATPPRDGAAGERPVSHVPWATIRDRHLDRVESTRRGGGTTDREPVEPRPDWESDPRRIGRLPDARRPGFDRDGRWIRTRDFWERIDAICTRPRSEPVRGRWWSGTLWPGVVRARLDLIDSSRRVGWSRCVACERPLAPRLGGGDEPLHPSCRRRAERAHAGAVLRGAPTLAGELVRPVVGNLAVLAWVVVRDVSTALTGPIRDAATSADRTWRRAAGYASARRRARGR